MVFFFFFSSRRRHTRYWRDWSSDVCSSDLALASPAAEPASGARARMLLGVGVLRWQAGGTDAAAAPLEEALALFRAQGDRAGTAWTLNALGCLVSDNGDLDRGVLFLREAQALFIDLDNKVGGAQVEGNLGEDAFVRGDFALAER